MAAAFVDIREGNAPAVAERLLEGVGARLAHSSAVAAQAQRAANLLDEPWRSVLVQAAWLHDIGYSDDLAELGFHPLDGARWLQLHGWPSEVCRLVAWHSDAEVEADLLGFARKLAAEFERPPALAAAILAWADLTASPTGKACTARERVAEILRRYRPGTAVHQAVSAARPSLLAAADRVEDLLEGRAAA